MLLAIEIICMLIIAAKSDVYQATYIDIFTFLHLHQSMINHYQFKCMHRVSFLGVNQKNPVNALPRTQLIHEATSDYQCDLTRVL